MKVAAYSSNQALMINEASGTILLTTNGKDKANNSVGMAIMKDDTINDTGKATFPIDRTINKGIIALNGVENSVGTYVNIASNITIPFTTVCQKEFTFIRLSPLLKIPMISAPTKVPPSFPYPPDIDVPPTTTAAMASISAPSPAVGCPEYIREAKITPARPAISPE